MVCTFLEPTNYFEHGKFADHLDELPNNDFECDEHFSE